MKRICIVLTALLVLLTTINFRGITAEETYTIALSGTKTTNCQNLLETQVFVSGQNIDNIKGTITYDATKLAFFKIETTSAYSSWDFEYNTSKNGTISFEGSVSDTSTSSDVINNNDGVQLLKVIFVVHYEKATSVKITASKCSSNITSLQDVEIPTDEVTNQAEIDAATLAHQSDETVVIPEPIYGTVTEPRQVTSTISYNSATQSVNIIERAKSNDAYLHSLSIGDYKSTTTFSKTWYAYSYTVPTNVELDIKYETEDPNATVVVTDEVNKQIQVIVTAEDGTQNIYVLTIVRQDDYNDHGGSTAKPTDPTDPVNPDVPIESPTNVSIEKAPLLISIVIALIGIIGFVFGGKLIYKGARED